MKNKLNFISALAILWITQTNAQEQFSGLLNSPRVSLLQGLNNPAELVNLDKKNEITGANISFQVSNNKISTRDIFSNTNLESKLFNSNESINMSVTTQFTSLGYGMKWKRFGVSLSSNTYGILNIENINPQLGDALVNSGSNFSSMLPLNIQSNGLQKIDLAMFTDIAVGFGMKVLDFKKHKINAGVNAKLLFPKSFVNIGIDNFNANLTAVNQNVNALTATGNINIAYNSDVSLNSASINPLSGLDFSQLKGVSLGFGFNYQLYRDKDLESDKTNNYFINFGANYSNSGTLKFDSNKTKSHNYALNVSPNMQNPNGLDLNQIGSISSPEGIYNFLNANNFLNAGTSNTEVEIKMPRRINLYADVKILKILYGSVYWQKNLNESSNISVSSPDFISVTPRLVFGKFEFFTPVTNNSIATTTVGAGLKWGMFYMSSGSGLSIAFSDTKQVDLSIGLSKAF